MKKIGLAVRISKKAGYRFIRRRKSGLPGCPDVREKTEWTGTKGWKRKDTESELREETNLASLNLQFTDDKFGFSSVYILCCLADPGMGEIILK